MKIKSFFKKYENVIYPLLSLGLFVTVWAVYAASVNIELIIPTPLATLKKFFGLLGQKSFWAAFFGTFLRILSSFCMSYVLAVAFAVVGAICKPFYRLLSPIVTVLRATPTMSIILLSIIWFRSAYSPLFIAFLIVFPMCFTAIYEAIVNVDVKLVEMSDVYNVRKSVQIKKLYIPSVAPALFASAKSNISLNVKIIIAAEVLAQTADSMGNSMQIAKIYLDTAELLAWSLAAVLLSYALEAVVLTIKKAVVKW